MDKQGDVAFIVTGFDNWKKALDRFDHHVKSAMHREAVIKIDSLQCLSVAALLSTQLQKDQQVRRQMLMVTLSSLRFLLRQGLAVRGHIDLESNLIQLLLVRSETIPGLKQYIDDKQYLSPQILNELIARMSNTVLRQLLAEIRESSMFSIIVDKATDVSQNEQLCVAIRWVDSAMLIHETPVELMHVPKTDADTLAGQIKDCMLRLALPNSQCHGQAYDGAANMKGHICGVAAIIQQAEPKAIYVHCLAHCTNLCLQTTAKKLLCIRESLELVMGLT